MTLVENINKQKGITARFSPEDTDYDVEFHLRNLNVHPRVVELLKLPQWEQRTQEWFEQRKGKLTASDIDAVCENNKYQSRTDVLFKKSGIAPPFTGNIATRHGQKYEDEAIGHYCSRYGKKVFDFGLLPHPTVDFLAGSPDGITYDGIVLEVKCPIRRKIVQGEIPEHYKGQIYINMEIADLDRGVFIEYIPQELSDTGEMQLNVVEVERDPEWFKAVYPKLLSFWKEVEHYSKAGIETHPEYKKYYLKANPVVKCYSNPDDFDPDKKCLYS